ncbi:MAG: amidohydrolase [Armatimonadetes bacterium]|nr:amidohydrolase [Armatimonadota bacterium]
MGAELLTPTEKLSLVELRHDLHRNPELGFEEVRTSGIVQAELERLGIQIVNGMAKGTGVLGWLPATNPGAKTIALRADMDCLPIHEETGVEYKSEHAGRMHACGHDAHVTMLIGAARHLAALKERPNNVLFLFQPAEEGGGGGKFMVDEGALDGSRIGKPVDAIFALHGQPLYNVGQLGTRPGPITASADQFILTFKGKGGHAAYPHLSNDPIVIASHFVTALQSVVSRSVSPIESGVITIGRFAAGTASNIIPDEAVLEGTIRALSDEVREVLLRRIKEIAHGVADAFGAKAEFFWHLGYPVTVNHPVAMEYARESLTATNLDVFECEASMVGEDFSFYGKHVPACFSWLGLKLPNEESRPALHNPKFDFNDEAIALGVSAHVAFALGPADRLR